jgi:hypothetical protein
LIKSDRIVRDQHRCASPWTSLIPEFVYFKPNEKGRLIAAMQQPAPAPGILEVDADFRFVFPSYNENRSILFIDLK